MKLVLLIGNDEFREQTIHYLTEYNLRATLVSSSGDFLQFGEDVYLLGIDEEKEEQLKQCLSAMSNEMKRYRDFGMMIYVINMEQMIAIHSGQVLEK